jgi:hypothetical protein
MAGRLVALHTSGDALTADAVKDLRLEFDGFLKLASQRAIFYGDAGRLDEALDCLDQAIASRDPAPVDLAIAPQWYSLRGDPRFCERLERLSLNAWPVQ